MTPKDTAKISVIESGKNDWATPPQDDQIELTVFGPGFGESCLVHLGSNRWIIVDSCLERETGLSAPLSYLDKIGSDASKTVQLVVATHWHDDHIRGLSEVVARCSSAKFSCANAMTGREFLGMAAAFNRQRMLKGGSGVREIQAIMEVLVGTDRPPIRFASASRPLLRIDGGALGHGYSAQVTALSPSDREFELFLRNIAKLFPAPGVTQYRCPALSPNLAAVVVWVDIGETRVLLGADLEQSRERERGWNAVLNDQTRPSGEAHLFKVPHRGSRNAFNSAVWTRMLINTPLAVTTPWTRGGLRLPNKEDQMRLTRQTPHAFLTALPSLKKSRKPRPPAVLKTLREMKQKITESEPKMGAVRFRNGGLSAWSTWTVSLSGPARQLQPKSLATSKGCVS